MLYEVITRVISATGEPLDGGGGIEAIERMPVEQDAPSIMERAPVATPLKTGIKELHTSTGQRICQSGGLVQEPCLRVHCSTH